MLKGKLSVLGLALVPLGIGLVAGLAVPWDYLRDKMASSMADEAEDDQQAASESDAVILSQMSQTAMSLTTGRIQYSEYQTNFEVPAFVREIPGAGDLRVSSRFAGLVKRVLISEGQTVQPGQPILEVELTGDLLANAQSELLDAQKQISIIELEIARLAPSVRGGGVANKRLIQMKYERDRLVAKVETKSQELLVRGITQPQVDEIIRTKKLLRTVIIRVPDNLIPPQLNAGDKMDNAPASYLVEQLLARPGSMTEVGQDLCELSFHAVLVVEGQAYEKDLPRIREAIGKREPVRISIGPEETHEHIDGQKVAYLSNHVDDATNTYPFYIYLKNENVFGYSGSLNADEYVTWKWKPGQRAHVEIPDLILPRSIVIPRDALAVDGLTNYVFVWAGIVEEHHEEDADHEAHEPMDKFKAIEVVVRHLDRQQVVIELNDQLSLGDRIANNNADRLLFAMQAGDGAGGNHHGHSH